MNNLEKVNKESLLNVSSMIAMKGHQLKTSNRQPFAHRLSCETLYWTLWLLMLHGRKKKENKFMGRKQPRPNVSFGKILSVTLLQVGK